MATESTARLQFLFALQTALPGSLEPASKESLLHKRLYRVYESLVLGDTIGLYNEIGPFFHTRYWRIASTPDPKDPNPALYALLAVMVKFLVPAFNGNVGLSLSRDAAGIIRSREE